MRKQTVGWWLLLGPALPGCVVFDTLEGVDKMIEPQTGSAYYLYVPTTYKAQRAWPLIVACHGTPPFDTASFQIKQWKSLAESERFIVAAPKLVGTNGLVPPPPEEQIARQRRDERTILAVVNHVRGSRNIAASQVFLTGWSAGGYAVLFTGLRNPDVFRALSVWEGNFDERYLPPALPALDPYQPVHIAYGVADPLRDQPKASIEWLRDQRMFVVEESMTGGHQREPALAHKFFVRCVRDWPWVRVRAFAADSGQPRSVRFRVTASPEARTFRWDFGDGATARVASPEHTYAADGTYDVQVAIDLGGDEPVERIVRVSVPYGRRSPAPTTAPAPQPSGGP